MSQMKKYRLSIMLVLALVCFFMIGCKNKTPVEDIYFNLNSGEQIVLIVGQELDLNEYVVVKPSYASNRKFSVTSLNPDVVRVDGTKLIAEKEDHAVIKVASKDNALKECMMTVVVKATQEQLIAPLNLSYNHESQAFNFDPVTFASSYTININGEEFELGNSTTFDLNNYSGNKFDELLHVKVKANAPSYSYALKTSNYSNEYKLYQAGAVNNLKVEGGTVKFDKHSENNKHSIYLNNQIFANELTANYASLAALNELHAGQNVALSVCAVVDEEIKQRFGSDVHYFNSLVKEISVNILDVPNISLTASTLTWQNIAHASGYNIYIDGEKKAETSLNYFNLQSLADFDLSISTEKSHTIKVDPILADNSVNVGKTSGEALIRAQRLVAPDVSCDGSKISWDAVNNASAYLIRLNGQEIDLNSSTNQNNFSMANYPAGNYSVEVAAVAQDNPVNDGVFLLTSATTIKTFVKHQALNAYIENYVLKIKNLENGVAKLDFDTDKHDRLVDGSDSNITYFDLSEHEFEAGVHSIILTRLGDENSIVSDEFIVEFTQLEKIDSISISNGIVSVSRSDINSNAKIKLITEGDNLDAEIEIVNTGYAYNTENPQGENYLTAGAYATKVYVFGDGSSTFSYREDQNVVACASVAFEVLAAPSSTLNDPAVAKISLQNNEYADGYGVYNLTSGSSVFEKIIETNEFAFALAEGSATYQFRTLGDGESYLNSALSHPITVTRLETPKLHYNNITNVITKEDSNIANLVAGYQLLHNDKVVTYDFSSPFVLADATTGNKFDLYVLAVGGADGQYYLNSHPETLNLNEISAVATINLDGLSNNLIITPASHKEKYDLVVEFGLNGSTKTFSTKIVDDAKTVLSNGLTGKDEILLNYHYSSGEYLIELIDENRNAIIEEMNQEFTAKVRFVKPSTGDDTMINSQFSDVATLNLIRIDSETSIYVNAESQIVVEPKNHNQEFALVGVVMIGETFGYIVESNGEGQLICNKYVQISGGIETIGTIQEPVGLNYQFKNGKYYIDVLNDKKELLIPGLTSSADVKVKYSFAHNGVATDLDSDYCSEQTISVQPRATLSRNGQTIKISNVKDTYSYLNYYLLINNYPLELDEKAINVDKYIVFDVEYIYENVPANKLTDINNVEVVVKNNETSTENPVLSAKGGNILIKKTETVELSCSKDNNAEDNSAIISFATYETSYSKEYVVEIQHNGEKVYDKHYIDTDAIDGAVEFRIDDIAELAGLSGVVNVFVHVRTSGSIVEEETIYMFNSINSNVVSLNKIVAPSDLLVEDSTLRFNSIANAVGYEIYEQTGVGYNKLNTALITSNSYDISSMVGTKILVVKAISVEDGHTNSSYSDTITINKLAQPTISVINGKFRIKLSMTLLSLLMNDKVTITPEIKNGTTNTVRVNLDDLDGKDLVFDMMSLSLIAEPYLFMAYNNASLQAETLTVELKISQTEAVNGVYYLNSDPISMDCHGLFEPTEVKKTTKENNTVEMISWTANSKNSIASNELSVGYIFKIEYSGTEKAYYSDDENLKYYDSATETYVSYPSNINGTSAIFPAGYGLNEDGSLKVKFEAGIYKVSVQSVPLSTIDGYNLLSSKYSTQCEFEIMAASVLSVEEGKVVWNKHEKASYYTVSIFEQDGKNPLHIDTAASAEYDFSNALLDELVGVYKVVVKSISEREDTLNSAESEPLFVYRLPQANEVSVDDGNLILSASAFFSTAEVELVDSTKSYRYTINCDNTANIDANLATLNINNWKDFDKDNVINQSIKFAIRTEGGLNVLEGRDYIINVKLFGNTSDSLGLISSIKVENLSNLIANKLKPNVAEVNLGVVKFMPDAEYATIADNVYTSAINVNYDYNESGEKEFWSTTAVYKIVIKSANGETPIYAVDYYSFITSVANSKIKANDYIMMNGAHGLYACVKYSYTDQAQQKTLYFNVYQENKLNLRDYESLYYYPITEKMTHGISSLEGVETAQTLDLSSGGNFSVDIYMIGGDSITNGELSRGYISSKINAIKMFHRYNENKLSSFEGQVQFQNLTSMKDGEVYDYPVYKLVVKNMDQEILNTYYFYHTTEDDARQIAARHDPENYEHAIYLEATSKDEMSTILFDMSQRYAAGSYLLNLRTLAGLGQGEDDARHYIINAADSQKDYPFHKLTDTEVYSSQGVLEFKQSYVISDGRQVPYSNYEITLTDKANGKEYIYNIDENSEGVTVDTSRNVVQYILPKTMKLETEKGNMDVVFDGGKQFSIKVCARAKDNFILNGTYKQAYNNEDVEFVFEKSKGADDIKVEDGMLKWKVLDLENYQNTYICVSFEDENFKTKSFKPISVGNITRVDVDGVYQYHYYQFIDGNYDLETSGSGQIKHKIIRNYPEGARADIVEYKITLYTSASASNIVNSNYSTVVSSSRLDTVDASTIKTVDGLLCWDAVQDAVKYDVYLLGNKNYQFTTTETTIDFLQEDRQIEAGIYDIEIRAIGGSKITAMMSTYGAATGFEQLKDINFDSIRIEDDKIVWNAVENADKYKIVFTYKDSTGTPQEITDDSLLKPEFVVPEGTQGTFSIVISAISVGEGKEFNGRPTQSFTSSSETPIQVENFEFDEQNSRLIIDVKAENFLNTDSLLILFNLAEYTVDGIKATQAVNDTISYMKSGSYIKLDESTYRYYYPLLKMGKYTNISVQVTRPGTVPSNAVSIVDIDLNWFAYGAGTQENPYRILDNKEKYGISGAQQLLNIERSPSAHYVLESSIIMSDVNVLERLESKGAIIADEFKGHLDGQGFSIWKFNVDELNKTDTIALDNVENFALFNTLNAATIKNLTIGSENIQLILLNTFAKSSSNMVNLSLIATGANNSKLDNVDVLNFKTIVNSVNSSSLSGVLNVSGLIGTATNSLVNNSMVNFETEINILASGQVYVGGAIANANNSTISNSTISFTSTASNNESVLLYVGGAIGYFEGNTAKTAGITDTDVEINIVNLKSIYLGGLVGFARHINIAGSETAGTYTRKGINYQLYLGGLVGAAQSSTIANSGTLITFEDNNGNDTISISSITEKYIGAIVGSLTVANTNIDCEIKNCYINSSYREETTVTTSQITLGVYGYKDTAATIENCYKLEN